MNVSFPFVKTLSSGKVSIISRILISARLVDIGLAGGHQNIVKPNKRAKEHENKYCLVTVSNI